MKQQLGLELPDNIIPENEGVLGNNSFELWMEGSSTIDAVEKRLNQLQIKPRQGAVLAHEYVLGVSKDWYEKANYSASGMLANMLKYVTNRYGKENIISTANHFDKSTPHIHILVMPLVKKKRKWKNRNGSGVKVSIGLSGSDFIDGKDTLTQLQTDFFEYSKQWDRGDAQIIRGLKSEAQSKVYTEKTNHLLGELRELNDSIAKHVANIKERINVAESKKELEKQNIKHQELNREIAEQQKLLAKAKKETARRKMQNKNGGWKKGMDF